MLSTKNWTLNSYTAATWTDLIDQSNKSTLATLVIANTAVGDAVVQIRLTDDTPTSLAVIMPPKTIAAGAAEVLDVRSINISGTQRIQIQVDIVGVEFTASGVEEV